MEQPRRIIGIDPGTRSVGYGVVESRGSSLRFLGGGCISANAEEIASRLVTIHHELQIVIREFQPQAAAIETVFAGNNVKTAIAIGEGRGVAVLSAAELGVAVFGYEPALVKRTVTGSGRASKEQVQQMVRILLNLGEIPATDHEADALALAITHVNRDRFGLSGIKKSPSPRCGKKAPRFR